MSHDATRWANRLRGITPGQYRVVMVLADCHNPAHGCFPTQDYLAEACEMGERTVREHLQALEDMGHIARERTVNEWGHRTGTRYVLAFESLPAETPGREKPTGKKASAYRQKDVKPTGNCLPVDIDKPVIEPVIEPVSSPIIPFQVVKAEIVSPFDAFWMAYPKKVSKGDALKAWTKAVRKTSPPEIMAGLERSIAGDGRFRTKQYTPYPATWLNDESWNDEHPSSDLQSGAGAGRSIDPFLNAAMSVDQRRRAGGG